MGADFHRERSIDPSSRNPNATRQGSTLIVADCLYFHGPIRLHDYQAREGGRDDGQRMSRGWKGERCSGMDGFVVSSRFENRKSQDGSTGTKSSTWVDRYGCFPGISLLDAVQSQHARWPLQGYWLRQRHPPIQHLCCKCVYCLRKAEASRERRRIYIGVGPCLPP